MVSIIKYRCLNWFKDKYVTEEETINVHKAHTHTINEL